MFQDDKRESIGHRTINGIIVFTMLLTIEAYAGHEHPAVRKSDGIYELIRYKHSPALAALDGLNLSEMHRSSMTSQCLLSDITENKCSHTFICTLNTACSTE